MYREAHLVYALKHYDHILVYFTVVHFVQVKDRKWQCVRVKVQCQVVIRVAVMDMTVTRAEGIGPVVPVMWKAQNVQLLILFDKFTITI